MLEAIAAPGTLANAVRLAVLLMGGIALVQWIGPASLQLNTATYAGLHSLVEFFAVIVALLIFGIGWSSAGSPQTRLNVLLACAFLAVGLLDLLHLLSYAGMPDLVTPSDPEKAIFFWLAARLVGALGLLLLVFAPYQGSASHRLRAGALSVSLILVALTAWIGLWHSDLLPRTFIEGEGLTPLKIVAELSISVLFLVAAGALIAGRQPAAPIHADSLLSALITLAVSGLCFALYTQVSDGLNLLGHVYKILAYLFLYRAIFQSTVAQPYQDLARARDRLAHEGTALHASEARLREREERLGTLIATMHDGCLLYNAKGQVTLWNQRAEQILGLSAAQLRCQEPYPQGWRVLDEEGHDFLPAQHPALLAIENGRRYADIVVAIRQPDGALTWIIASATPLDNEHAASRGAFLIFTDISALKAAEIALRQQQLDLRLANAQLQALATTDGLTGLTNHRALQQSIAASTRLAEHSRQPLALIMLDIDHFKRFNDTFGHPSGDHVLRVVAGVLRATVRASDTVARYGGEEFAILLLDTDIHGAAETAERCRCAINDLIWEHWPITASFGVAAWHPAESLPQTLIEEADAALYQAKRNGRNQVALACCMQAQSSAA
jgi:diguanylate cyclase (GGDEF)-like protein/PAS domain S-box-containing protein